MKFMCIFLFLNYILLVKASLPIFNPGGIGGIFKGPNSETIVQGPDGSIITSLTEGGQVSFTNVNKTVVNAGVLFTETVNLVDPNSLNDVLIGQNPVSDSNLISSPLNSVAISTAETLKIVGPEQISSTISPLSVVPSSISIIGNVAVTPQILSSTVSPLSFISSTIQPELITLGQPELIKLSEERPNLLNTQINPGLANNKELSTINLQVNPPVLVKSSDLISTVPAPQIIDTRKVVPARVIQYSDVPLADQTGQVINSKLTVFLNPENGHVSFNPATPKLGPISEQLDNVALQENSPLIVEPIKYEDRFLINVESTSLSPRIVVSSTEEIGKNPKLVTISSSSTTGEVVTVTPRNPAFLHLPQNVQLQSPGTAITNPLLSTVDLAKLYDTLYFGRYGRETKEKEI